MSEILTAIDRIEIVHVYYKHIYYNLKHKYLFRITNFKLILCDVAIILLYGLLILLTIRLYPSIGYGQRNVTFAFLLT